MNRVRTVTPRDTYLERLEGIVASYNVSTAFGHVRLHESIQDSITRAIASTEGMVGVKSPLQAALRGRTLRTALADAMLDLTDKQFGIFLRDAKRDKIISGPWLKYAERERGLEIDIKEVLGGITDPETRFRASTLYSRYFVNFTFS